jgi:hypothetical protein
VHVLINHKVVAKNFPGVLAPVRVHLSRDGLHGVLNKLFELWKHGLHEVTLNAHGVEVLLEVGVGELYTLISKKVLTLFPFSNLP